MEPTLVTPPTVEPVTLAEARAQVRVTNTSHDVLLGNYIAAASRWVERHVGRSLTTRTWRLTLDAFADAIELPMGPVTAITALSYVDSNGESQTITDDNYTLDATSDPQWLVRNSSYTWPAPLDAVNVVSVTYVAGEASVSAHYADLKLAILLLIGEYFDNSGVASDAAIHAAKALCRPFRPPFVR